VANSKRGHIIFKAPDEYSAVTALCTLEVSPGAEGTAEIDAASLQSQLLRRLR
jgi:hypothetical protein